MEFEIFIDSKNVGNSKAYDMNIEYDHKTLCNGKNMKLYSFVHNKFHTIELKDVKINPEFKENFINLNKNKLYKLVAEHYDFPKGKTKLPKNKRIRKKWQKYKRIIEIDNCKIL